MILIAGIAPNFQALLLRFPNHSAPFKHCARPTHSGLLLCNNLPTPFIEFASSYSSLINMGSRKRGRDEMESSEPAPEQNLLDRIRSTWEFANIMQYIFIFGKAVKINEDLTIEVYYPTSILAVLSQFSISHPV